ncbi:MAG TPA: hypothetical protein VNC84_07120 [Gammaproteobacteria bacterium]|nr:hypothetical protein [Gammaproteobacteria bacterium]
MLDSHSKEINPPKLLTHLARSIMWGLVFIIIALYIGMLGYHLFEHMSWVDSFVNASMILSGMGPLSPLVTTAGKVFAGFYALFSGLAFLVVVGVMFAPIIHRFFRKIHLESKL